ncbi:MAG: M50 family metallopeptidase [Nocardiopsaceae bacterium]|nr:M50 family metallopeptidase [Nocardiopsaceae bacterium]
MQETHPPLPPTDAALIGLAALALTLVPLLRTLSGHFSVMSREGAHALLAFFLGFTVGEIALDRHSGGKTGVVAGEGLRLVIVLAAGYLGPSLFGLAAAWIIALGHPVVVIWLTVALLVLMMFLIARSFGCLSVPIAVALLVAALRYWHGEPDVYIAYGLTWLLLLSGVRFAVGEGVKAENAHNLRKATYVPRAIWALIWLAGSTAALLLGGKLLIYG